MLTTRSTLLAVPAVASSEEMSEGSSEPCREVVVDRENDGAGAVIGLPCSTSVMTSCPGLSVFMFEERSVGSTGEVEEGGGREGTNPTSAAAGVTVPERLGFSAGST